MFLENKDLKDLCENCSFRKVCEMNKKKQILQERLDIAVNRFFVIKNQIELWKSGHYGKTEHCAEYYIEQTVDEALEKITEIK